MGLFTSHTPARPTKFRPQKLPVDASVLALKPDACHCVADAELDNRYNLLRAEEHARKEGKCGPEWSSEVAERAENKARNRYSSVIPWDHSRVLLPVEEGENDYINASWIQMGSRTYIATQGPMNNTVNDFWQMVYAYGGEPAVIIMLTPLYEHAMEKCAKYWPDQKGHPIVLPKEHGFRFGLTVSLQSFHKNDHYHHSTFILTPSDKKMPERTVHHVYYHSWLDYSKPNADADLRALIHLVNNHLRNRACPPIVHCSAGIGRTGTFIALDALLTRIDTDILPTVVPRVVPVWKGHQHKIQFRPSLFTGMEDLHVEAEPNSPLLSKFDVAQGSSVVPTTLSSDTAKTTPPSYDVETSANGNSTPLGALKRSVPQNPNSQPSLLSTAIANHKKKELNLDSSTENRLSPAEEESLSVQTHCDCEDDTDVSEKPNSIKHQPSESNSPVESPKQKSSALSGPAIRKVSANITSVAPEVFSETPVKVDVMNWFDSQDPIMSTIRTMRKQRPKMVQGKQQLGYIYDQFEVGQQLARVTHHPNQALRRRSTTSSLASSPASHSFDSHHHHHHHHHLPMLPSKPRRILSLVGLRRSSTESTKSDTDSPSTTSSHSSQTATHKRPSIFTGSVLR